MKNTNELRITRRGVQLTLGFLWLLDGCLQLQHRMFTATFITRVVAPAADGQPRFVTGTMHFFMTLFLRNPAVWNTIAVLIQLGIGVLLLRRSTVRLGLLCSVLWGLFVWYVGEGLGGLLGGHASLLMGAPGAALLYVALSLAVIPPDDAEKLEKRHYYPAAWLSIVWAAVWVVGAVFQLLPGQNTANSLSTMIAANAQGAPGWLATLDIHLANSIHNVAVSNAQGSGYWLILFLAVIQLVIGVGVFAKKTTREFMLCVGISVAVLLWVVGQSLGGYWTGLATDPGTAPLLILLGLTILGQPTIDHELPKIYKKLEKLFI